MGTVKFRGGRLLEVLITIMIFVIIRDHRFFPNLVRGGIFEALIAINKPVNPEPPTFD